MSKIEPPVTITLDTDYSKKFRKLLGKHQKNTDLTRDMIDHEEERRKLE